MDVDGRPAIVRPAPAAKSLLLTKHATLEGFLAQFDESVHEAVASRLLKDGVDGVVMFENVTFDSSQCGARSALPYGPGCSTLKVLPGPEEHLHDLLSQRQYPTAYYAKPALPGPDAPPDEL